MAKEPKKLTQKQKEQLKSPRFRIAAEALRPLQKEKTRK